MGYSGAWMRLGIAEGRRLLAPGGDHISVDLHSAERQVTKMAKELSRSGGSYPTAEHEPLSGERIRAYSSIQVFFLTRLARLLRLRREYASQLPADSWRMKLIHKAAFSTYRDCVALGVGEEAKRLIENEEQERA